MYDIAKTARAALKSKARRLAEEKDEKVTSADWSPSEPLNADVKTGARPLKRRVYKSGGKVSGDCGPTRADRKPRKSGGRALTANSLINRDVREANEEREGIKHVGAFKKGGRVKKAEGGDIDVASLAGLRPVFKTKPAISQLAENMKKGGRTKKMNGGLSMNGKRVVSPTAPKVEEMPQTRRSPEPRPEQRPMTPEQEAAAQAEMDRQVEKSRKSGGRAKKMMGGPMMDARMGMVEPTRMKFSGAQGTPYKKGGKAEKPAARKGKAIGGELGQFLSPALMAANAIRGEKDEKAHGGRTARKDGGRTKGKARTNINIVIAAGRGKQDQDQDMPMPGGRAPMPAPRAAAAPMPGMMPPMAAAMGAPPQMPPPGAPPVMRKAGGRITKVASSYKDMEAGAGSGEGRLQKTDIAAKQPKPGLKRGTIVDDNKGYPNKVNGATGGRTARASGGKTYRSYKDMDAGAGSGKGRLEKTEIESNR